MWNRIDIMGALNINYMQIRSEKDSLTDFSTFPESLENPVWDSKTIALAKFDGNISASNFEGGNISYDCYKIFRLNEEDGSVKYIATVDNSTDSSKAIKDYCLSSDGRYRYLIYPVLEDGATGNVINSESITPRFNYWSVSEIIPTGEDKIYTVNRDNMWRFWLNPETGEITQTFGKSVKTGFKRYPVVAGSKINYTTLSVTVLLGDLICGEGEHSLDSVYKKNKWNEFANSQSLKLFTDPKGECLIGDITSTSSSVDYSVIQMPTSLTFEFTQTTDTKDISVYAEV